MKKLLLLLLITLLHSTVIAQWKFTLFGVQSNPLFNMKHQGYLSGAGLGAGAYYMISPETLFSLDLGGSIYGSSSGSRSGDSPIGNYTVSNGFTAAVLEGRVLMNLKKWSPYIEMHYGSVGYNTTEEVQMVSEQLLQVTTTNVGAGIGVLYKVADNFYFDLGVAFNSGSPADFLDLHSFTSQDQVIDYNINNANSNMLIIKLGLAFSVDFSSWTNNSGGLSTYYSSSSYYVPQSISPYPSTTSYSRGSQSGTNCDSTYDGGTSTSSTYSGGGNPNHAASSSSSSSGGRIIHKGKTPVGIK